MRRFQRILVAVDLASGDKLVSDELVPPSQESVDQAIWLAGHSGARLLFFNALEISERARLLIDDDDDLSSNVLGHAHGVLSGLVESAKSEGVSADFRIVFGKSWLEILRQVHAGQHDLVISGTRHRSRVRSALLGSTGMKLLRKCPCPVWITQPRKFRQLSSIVAATDFTPVCDFALDLAASLVELNEAALHIVHAMSLSDEAIIRRAGTPEADFTTHRENAEQHAQDQIDRLLARESLQGLPQKPTVHIEAGDANHVILEQLQSQSADLLAMGSLARSGLTGVLMGNTAERLLPRINCSLLAVKPEDFVCPVKFDQ
jgi:universal stress protein E